MKFSEIANRLTGISSPILGVSWQPGELEVSAARRVVAFLDIKGGAIIDHKPARERWLVAVGK